MKTIKTLLALLILGGLALLPLSWAQGLGRWLARRIINRPDSELHRITQINLQLCYPQLGETARRQLLESSLAHTAMALCEMGMAWLWRPRRTLAKVIAVNNESVIEQALAAERGCILIAPHLGNWEVLNLYLSARYPFTALYKPPKIKRLDQLIRRMRARLGTRMAAANRAGVRLLLQALRRGEMVGILPDQAPDTGGQFAPFFGVPAYSMTLLPQLVKQTGARVVCGFAERLPGGEGFVIHFRPADPDIYADDRAEALAAMNRSIEHCVQQIPAQYQWEYKRFQDQPDGSNPYRRQ